jgi:glycosyltransferase involved in cell wall biosynthesis
MKHAFLINTLTAWDEPPRARHQVANALSRNYPVVFVEANKKGLPSIKIRKIHSNLTLITPFFPVDVRLRYRIPVLNECYQDWLFRRLKNYSGDYKVINFDFTAVRIFKYFKNVIYYCNDSFYEISKKINPKPIASYHRKCEARVAVQSDFCVGVSKMIKEYLQNFNPNTLEIPLGSPNVEDYDISIEKSPSRNKQVNVVLVGIINKLTISNNIINLLLRDKSISLTFIGPVDNDFMKEIENKEKLILRGSLFNKDLYEEINRYDVAIAPYSIKSRNNMLTGTGAKIYHYLSVGKPVVISYMPGLDQLNLEDKLIYTANEEEAFPFLVRRAHEENTPELIQKRVFFAKQHTWEKRMEQLLSIYETFDARSGNEFAQDLEKRP